MCGYNLCCGCGTKPVFGGIYSNSAVTYEYEEGELQTVVLDVPMYTKNVAATVGTLTPSEGGYYLVSMSADTVQTAGTPGVWQIQLTLNDAAEGYFTSTISDPINESDKLSKTGITYIAAGTTVSLKAVSTENGSKLDIKDAHLCIVKIADPDPVCNCS
jgi:hypothetical protein